MSNPRGQRKYTEAAAAWLTAQQDLRCHWCHKQTYTDAPRAHPLKATVDHLIEVDTAPDLTLTQGLWVVACWTCNSSRGARYRARKRQRTPSRNW